MRTDIARMLRNLARDRHSGAAEIAAQAAQILRRLIAAGEPAEEDVRALLEAQPSMAPVIVLTNGTLRAYDRGGATAALHFIEAFLSELPQSIAATGEAAASLLRGKRRVIVYSYSSTIVAALSALARDRRKPQILLSECRPTGEGSNMARRSAELGYRVRFMVDAALFSALPEVDLALTGADALTRFGLVNKTGTRGLALACRAAKVPLLTLATGDKLLGGSLARFLRIADHAPTAIYPYAPPGVTVDNRWFDITPWDLLDLIIVDGEILTSEQIIRRLSATRPAPHLRRLLP